jgi:hypothetical protein
MGRGKKRRDVSRHKPRAVVAALAGVNLAPAVEARVVRELAKGKNAVQRAAAERVLAEGDTSFSIKKGTGKSLVWQFRHYLESGDAKMISLSLRECLANELNGSLRDPPNFDELGTGDGAAGTADPACFLGRFYYWNDRARVGNPRRNQYVYSDGMTSDDAIEEMLAVADEHKHDLLQGTLALHEQFGPEAFWSYSDAFAVTALATVCRKKIILGYYVPLSRRERGDSASLMVANADVTARPSDLSPEFGAGRDEMLIDGVYRISPARALEIAAAAHAAKQT